MLNFKILKSYNILFFIINDKEYDARMIGNTSIKSIQSLNKSYFKKIDTIFIEQSLNSKNNRNKILRNLNHKKKLVLKLFLNQKIF